MAKVSPKKVLVGVTYGNRCRDISDFYGYIDDVVSKLTQLKKEAETEGFSNLMIVVEASYYENSSEWSLRGDRLETDKEYEKRLAIEKKITEDKKKEKLRRDENDRKEYERLKKKFEVKN